MTQKMKSLEPVLHQVAATVLPNNSNMVEAMEAVNQADTVSLKVAILHNNLSTAVSHRVDMAANSKEGMGDHHHNSLVIHLKAGILVNRVVDMVLLHRLQDTKGGCNGRIILTFGRHLLSES